MQRGLRGIVSATLLCVAILMAAPTGNATELKFDGQVRVRVESFDRTFQSQPARSFVFQRVRFGIKAIVSDDTEAFVQFQDARIWGSETIAARPQATITLGPGSNVDLFQAYGQWNKKYSSAKVRICGGRQILSYGNERILGAVGWSPYRGSVRLGSG